MCADWFNTFQAFYIYVKETRFTIIGKVNVQSESSSIMNARRLQELGCRFEISGARFERPMMKDTWQLLNVFIMVCSWDLIMVGFTEKFWAWKPESDGENLFSFITVIDGLANVVRARSCLLERVEPQLLWCRKLPFAFSQHWGFHNFVWILHWRVVVVLPRRLHRNRQGIVRFGGLWPSHYLSVCFL